MAKFILTFPIERATGWQQYSVDAADKAEALAKHERGESKFDCEDVNVSELGDPEIDEVR